MSCPGYEEAPPCLRAFKKGQAERLARPLPFGLYKLNEARSTLVMVLQTMKNVGKFIRDGQRGYGIGLGGCTSDDKAKWLKDLPAVVAHELGYNVLPAIAALAANGVLPSDIVPIIAKATDEAAQIVAQCELVRETLRAGIKREYDLMRQGDSMLAPLLQDAIDLIDQARAAARLHHPGLWPPRPV